MWMPPPTTTAHSNIWPWSEHDTDLDFKCDCILHAVQETWGADFFHIWPCCDLDFDPTTFNLISSSLTSSTPLAKVWWIPSIVFLRYRANKAKNACSSKDLTVNLTFDLLNRKLMPSSLSQKAKLFYSMLDHSVILNSDLLTPKLEVFIFVPKCTNAESMVKLCPIVFKILC